MLAPGQCHNMYDQDSAQSSLHLLNKLKVGTSVTHVTHWRWGGLTQANQPAFRPTPAHRPPAHLRELGLILVVVGGLDANHAALKFLRKVLRDLSQEC